MNNESNKKDEKSREWKKPTINRLEVNLTKGGLTESNNENKVHWSFSGQS